MKFHILAGLLFAGLAWSAQADDADSSSAARAEIAAEKSVAAESQIGTERATDMLTVVTARMGAKLEARLERAMSGHDNARDLPERLLVSTH